MCIFCKIVANEIPKNLVYSDDICEVIMDINPNADGHMLIIPKKHFNDIYDTDNETLLHMLKVFKEVSAAAQDALNADGITMYENFGLHQEIKHFHMHVLPVYKEQHGLKFLQQGDSNLVSENLEKIKTVLNK